MPYTLKPFSEKPNAVVKPTKPNPIIVIKNYPPKARNLRNLSTPSSTNIEGL